MSLVATNGTKAAPTSAAVAAIPQSWNRLNLICRQEIVAPRPGLQQYG
jgi:hypothetical protein